MEQLVPNIFKTLFITHIKFLLLVSFFTLAETNPVPSSEVNINVKNCNKNCDQQDGNPFDISPDTSGLKKLTEDTGLNALEDLEEKGNKLSNNIKDTYDPGTYSTVCWTEIKTVTEYTNGSAPTVIYEYAISFDSPADIPREYLDKEKEDGTEFYKNTKKSYSIPVEIVKRTNDTVVKKYKNVTCGSGPLYTREINLWPGKNKKKFEIKVSPKNMSDDCNMAKDVLPEQNLLEPIKTSNEEEVPALEHGETSASSQMEETTKFINHIKKLMKEDSESPETPKESAEAPNVDEEAEETPTNLDSKRTAEKKKSKPNVDASEAKELPEEGKESLEPSKETRRDSGETRRESKEEAKESETQTESHEEVKDSPEPPKESQEEEIESQKPPKESPEEAKESSETPNVGEDEETTIKSKTIAKKKKSKPIEDGSEAAKESSEAPNVDEEVEETSTNLNSKKTAKKKKSKPNGDASEAEEESSEAPNVDEEPEATPTNLNSKRTVKKKKSKPKADASDAEGDHSATNASTIPNDSESAEETIHEEAEEQTKPSGKKTAKKKKSKKTEDASDAEESVAEDDHYSSPSVVKLTTPQQISEEAPRSDSAADIILPSKTKVENTDKTPDDSEVDATEDLKSSLPEVNTLPVDSQQKKNDDESVTEDSDKNQKRTVPKKKDHQGKEKGPGDSEEESSEEYLQEISNESTVKGSKEVSEEVTEYEKTISTGRNKKKLKKKRLETNSALPKEESTTIGDSSEETIYEEEINTTGQKGIIKKKKKKKIPSVAKLRDSPDRPGNEKSGDMSQEAGTNVTGTAVELTTTSTSYESEEFLEEITEYSAEKKQRKGRKGSKGEEEETITEVVTRSEEITEMTNKASKSKGKEKKKKASLRSLIRKDSTTDSSKKSEVMDNFGAEDTTGTSITQSDTDSGTSTPEDSSGTHQTATEDTLGTEGTGVTEQTTFFTSDQEISKAKRTVLKKKGKKEAEESLEVISTTTFAPTVITGSTESFEYSEEYLEEITEDNLDGTTPQKITINKNKSSKEEYGLKRSEMKKEERTTSDSETVTTSITSVPGEETGQTDSGTVTGKETGQTGSETVTGKETGQTALGTGTETIGSTIPETTTGANNEEITMEMTQKMKMAKRTMKKKKKPKITTSKNMKSTSTEEYTVEYEVTEKSKESEEWEEVEYTVDPGKKSKRTMTKKKSRKSEGEDPESSTLESNMKTTTIFNELDEKNSAGDLLSTRMLTEFSKDSVLDHVPTTSEPDTAIPEEETGKRQEISKGKKPEKQKKWKRVHIRRKKPKHGNQEHTKVISEEVIDDIAKVKKIPLYRNKTTKFYLRDTTRPGIDSQTTLNPLIEDFATRLMEVTPDDTPTESATFGGRKSLQKHLPKEQKDSPESEHPTGEHHGRIHDSTTENDVFYEEDDQTEKQKNLVKMDLLNHFLKTNNVSTPKPCDPTMESCSNTEEPLPDIAKKVDKKGRVTCVKVRGKRKKVPCPKDTSSIPYLKDVIKKPEETFYFKMDQLEKLLDFICNKTNPEEKKKMAKSSGKKSSSKRRMKVNKSSSKTKPKVRTVKKKVKRRPKKKVIRKKKRVRRPKSKTNNENPEN